MFKSVFQPVQSFTPAGDLRKKALLECYGSKFKYSEFQVMSSVASVVVYTVAMFFGLGMMLVSPVSHNDAKVVFFLLLLTLIRSVILLRSYFHNQEKAPQKSK